MGAPSFQDLRGWSFARGVRREWGGQVFCLMRFVSSAIWL